MKAVVFHGGGDIHVNDIPEPQIREPNDAIVHLTASASCGTIRTSCAPRCPG